ncbi:hypothetical protein SRHO_G00078580 [Serrasalmus rhombeus]
MNRALAVREMRDEVNRVQCDHLDYEAVLNLRQQHAIKPSRVQSDSNYPSWRMAGFAIALCTGGSGWMRISPKRWDRKRNSVSAPRTAPKDALPQQTQRADRYAQPTAFYMSVRRTFSCVVRWNRVC